MIEPGRHQPIDLPPENHVKIYTVSYVRNAIKMDIYSF